MKRIIYLIVMIGLIVIALLSGCSVKDNNIKHPTPIIQKTTSTDVIDEKSNYSITKKKPSSYWKKKYLKEKKRRK